MPRSASERELAARVAALESWAATPDRSARTRPAREALEAKFRPADTAGMSPEAIILATDAARRAYYARMALQSARSRRLAREAREAVGTHEALASAADAELARVEDAGAA